MRAVLFSRCTGISVRYRSLDVGCFETRIDLFLLFFSFFPREIILLSRASIRRLFSILSFSISFARLCLAYLFRLSGGVDGPSCTPPHPPGSLTPNLSFSFLPSHCLPISVHSITSFFIYFLLVFGKRLAIEIPHFLSAVSDRCLAEVSSACLRHPLTSWSTQSVN